MKKVLLASAVSLAVAGVSSAALAADGKMEKCFGVVKAGQNDCGANGHSCAGKAKVDGDPKEWLYVPQGLCAKLATSK